MRFLLKKLEIESKYGYSKYKKENSQDKSRYERNKIETESRDK